jgi:hypothetical protein
MTRILAGLGLLFAVGCGRVENLVDCFQICEAYENCFDASYDVSACTDRCKDQANNDRAYYERAQACETCIDNRDCAAITVNCTDECAGIIP